MEGGVVISIFNMNIIVVNFIVDDGGFIDVSDGGYIVIKGLGSLLINNWRWSGVGYGGIGGRGSCGGYYICWFKKGLLYGNLYYLRDFGSGGDGNGGKGGGILSIFVVYIL